jgi:hypothetical protein
MKPTAEQSLLLRAALLPGRDAIEAWELWRTRTTIETLEEDSQWLLPLLYRNLHAAGVPEPLLVRYRNVYLHNWYKNSLSLRRAEPAIRRLERTREVVVLLGGSAMALMYYDAVGARPFDRPAVLVPVDPDNRRPVGPVDEVDVWPSLFGRGLDELLVARTRPVCWNTLRARVFDPADQLVDICMRRRAWHDRSSLFWIADAAQVLKRTPDLTRKDVEAAAAEAGVADVVAEVLACLWDGLAVPVPSRLSRVAQVTG